MEGKKPKQQARPRASPASKTAQHEPRPDHHVTNRKSNLKFEINQLYLRVRKEKDGRKKSELHKKLLLLKKLSAQRKDNHCQKALLQAIKKQQKREAQLMSKRLARWKMLEQENTSDDATKTKLPPKEELERVEQQVQILKTLHPEDFLPWLGLGKKSNEAGGVNANKEAVIKRILKTKFVREEYEKLHEIKDKEKHVKDIQKDKRDQRRTLKRKRPAATSVVETGTEENAEQADDGEALRMEEDNKQEEAQDKEEEEEEAESTEDRVEKDDEEVISELPEEESKPSEAPKQTKKPPKQKTAKSSKTLSSIFVSSLNGSVVNEGPAQKKRRILPSEESRSTRKTGKDSQSQKKLHPSWEAKKTLKDKQTINKFEGKKIKFED